MTVRLLSVLLLVVFLCVTHLRPNTVRAQAAPESPQEQCKKLTDLSALARKGSKQIKSFEGKDKKPLTSLPGGTFVEVEIPEVAPEGSEYCASLGGKYVAVVTAIPSADKEKRTTVTLDVPEIDLGWTKPRELVLVSFLADKTTRRLKADSPGISAMQSLKVFNGRCDKISEDLGAIAGDASKPIKYVESKNKKQLTRIPGGTFAAIEIPEVAPEGSEYCASLGGKYVGVVTAIPSADKEKRTTVTLDVPEIDFGWSTPKELVLVSFIADKTTRRLRADSFHISVKQILEVSDGRFSFLCAVAAVILAYLLIVLAIGRIQGSYCWDPVYLTSDSFDKASLSQLQVLGFSLLVIGLLVFVLIRTGTLTDISEHILLLLGISAGGTAGSKVAELMTTRLSFENWSWLRNRGWLTVHEEGTSSRPNPAFSRWGDLLRANDGSLDVYSFQLAVVSVFVGFALVRSDLSALETFTIPTHLLGLLGLSNVTYIGGKAVAPTSVGELNKKMDTLRAAEKNWIGKVTVAVIAVALPNKQQTAVTSAPTEYQEYITAARETARMLKSLYGADGTMFKLEPIPDSDLMPVFP